MSPRKFLAPHANALLYLFFTFGLYFVVLFARMMEIKPDGLYVGHVHLWGDWALHIAMASIFAYKSPANWLAYHPYFAGGKFTYGFLTNMISGLLMRAGFSIPVSFMVPSMIYALLLILGMYAVFYQVLKSQKAAAITITIFFLSSGLGFIPFLIDWSNHPTLATLTYTTVDYSRIEKYQWLAGNFITGMFLPQRAFLLGMMMAVWILAGVLYVLQHPLTAENNRLHRAILISCGVLAGIMPIVHMHSLIALVVITGLLCFVHLERIKEWLFYVIPAGLTTALFYFAFVSGGIENPQFMQIMIGWSAHGTGLVSWLQMWWEIWGIMLPLAVIGFFFILLVERKSKLIVTFYLSFFMIFALGNIILFQPVQWDNSKLFLWAYFGFSGLAAAVIAWLWRQNWSLRVVAVVLGMSLTLMGGIELVRLQRVDRNELLMASNDDMQLGKDIREHTDELAVFLTAETHNHPVMMWGARPILMGYPTWVWNFGFLYTQREKDIHTMFLGGPQTISLLQKYHVSYVAIGPTELHDYAANEAFFAQKFPLALSSQYYRIYDVRGVGK